MSESPKQQIAFFEQEVNEILGKPPRYLVRWGVTLYLILFCIVVFLSATVTYPEYASFEAEVIPLNTAQYAILNEAEKITALNIKDGSEISKNQKIYNTENGSLKAKIDGEIRFLKPISNGYTSTGSDTILQINPAYQDYKLVLKVPVHHINKIKIGQVISFHLDSKIIDGEIQSIPTNPLSDDFYYIEAVSKSNRTFISSKDVIAVDILIDNKKIFNKILNL